MYENSFTREEWFYLLRLLSTSGSIFAPRGAEIEALTGILWKTVWFHKFEEHIPARCFTRGDLRVAWFPSRYVRQSMWRAVTRLEESRVLSTYRMPGPQTESVIRVEAAAMLVCLCRLYPRQGMLVNLRDKLRSYWSENQWDVPEIKVEGDVGVLLKNIPIDEIKARGKERLKKKAEKRKLAPDDDIKPSWVFDYLREACAELEVHYGETLPTMKERKIAKGSAANFLLYCREDGLDPRQIIYDVCANWHRLRTGALVTAEGKELTLASAVSFMEFFRYRREILLWLAENKDSKPDYEVEYT